MVLSLFPPALAAMRAGGSAAGQVTTLGSLVAWGSDAYGELGDGVVGEPLSNPIPTAVPGGRDIVVVAAGDTHTLAVRADGTVLAWGDNFYGQVGDGSSLNRVPAPTAVAGLRSIVAVAAGGNHSLALKSDGTVLAWGDDTYGQLGDRTAGNPSFNPRPGAVAGVRGVVAIAAGDNHSLALKADGTILAWGSDLYGQLGGLMEFGPTSNPTPTAVPQASGVVAIATRSNYNLALRADGTVLAWGADFGGALGDGEVGTPDVAPVPRAIPGVAGITAIAAGGGHALALQADGTVLAWGADFGGGLGDGIVAMPEWNPTPKTIPGLAGVVAIAAGGGHSLALLRDGRLFAWGFNYFGALGNGQSGNPLGDPTPKNVSTVSGVVAIAAGGEFSLALTAPASTRPLFGDVASDSPARAAIEGLAARGVIKGCDQRAAPPLFCPDDFTLRAQMAALVARSLGWDAEDHGNAFPDRCAGPQRCVDDDLWRDVGTLSFYGVATGYPDGTFNPFGDVLLAQAISFITRCMVQNGFWAEATVDTGIYPNVPTSSGHRLDVVTYVEHVGPIPGATDLNRPLALWDQPIPRAWFARALWMATQGR